MHPRTALEAISLRPQAFLRSSWPWRSLAYLASSVLLCGGVGLVAAVIGLLEPVPVQVVAGLAAFVAAVPLVAGFERRRLRLVDAVPIAQPPDGRWRGVGLAVASLLALWWIDVVMVGLTVGGPVLLILSPAVQPLEPEGELTLAQALAVSAASVLLLLPAVYTFTAWAGARGAMARGLLASRDAELSQVLRSRARLVDAFETERRRIERDLHDGAQQRLVALSMRLGLARLDLPPDSPAGEQLAQAHQEAKRALSELRELIRGVHTQVLTDRGLPAAVREAAGRSPIPVDVNVALDDRLPAAVEVAAYYVVSEALANIAKHSRAGRASVHGQVTGRVLLLEIRDDGVGGADPSKGTGLTGLSDRLAVVDGRMSLSSPAGGPTLMRVEIPCA
ncbi:MULTISPECIES: sensor histidine kinase [Streptosporangium]|uniref:histidine kinase n=1 Tax=Streptosporangium brasiliense TaxID=47480 RepID=A0ABT9RFP7_9ACTN|nr:histidine kinase [Streptosporangium brasiliense]MDP9868106.1 signal transduction histidine kinase [Streptosporangium brasiliense]